MGAIKVLIQYGCRLDVVSQLHKSFMGPSFSTIIGTISNMEILKLLHAAGTFTGENFQKCLMHKKLHFSGSENRKKLLKELTSYPLKLSLICQKSVRDVIQKPLPSSVRQLGLPPIISEFLLYSDI